MPPIQPSECWKIKNPNLPPSTWSTNKNYSFYVLKHGRLAVKTSKHWRCTTIIAWAKPSKSICRIGKPTIYPSPTYLTLKLWQHSTRFDKWAILTICQLCQGKAILRWMEKISVSPFLWNLVSPSQQKNILGHQTPQVSLTRGHGDKVLAVEGMHNDPIICPPQ